MTTKIILLFTLIVYSIITSQSFMYLLSLKSAQLDLSANAYIEFRKLVDAAMRNNFKYVIYAALLSNLLLLIAAIKHPSGLLFITVAIAFIALVIDTTLTIKGNMPINDMINSWSVNNYPSNWAEQRTKWLDIFQYRQIANITGFISLLVGTVFGLR
ncbi:hypothetical protein [Ferruginibacter sp.]